MPVKVLVMKGDSKVLITKIREVAADIGEPDCELTDPVEFTVGKEDWKDRLQRWPGKGVTTQNKCKISSDAILTIVDPESELLSEYLKVIE
tara:strand:+ start:410 stop:682 length:273 start_codon:yes stop_codon:yes gene_type:complete